VRYVAYDQLVGVPNIVVDGYGNASTVLTLSHWPGSGTPDELKADLSTQIAFRYLDRPDLKVTADAVTNNHYDEDGLCGIYAVLHPEDARRNRARLEDIASAGDFGTYSERDSARIAFALMTYADEDRSPIGDQMKGLPYPRQTEVLYTTLLEVLPDMLAHPDRYEDLWAGEDAEHQRTLDEIARGDITIAEQPEIDLAVVTVSATAKWPHASAINNATRRMRVLTMHDHRYELRYRYETWVVYVSEPVAKRVDLQPLAEELSATDDARWQAGDTDDITPALSRKGPSSIDPATFATTVSAYLARA
jgi:hypothetical protein